VKVKDIMTSDPACCGPTTPLSEVAKMMVDNDCGEIPVVEQGKNNRPVGVVTDRDITVRAVAAGRNPLEMTAQDCMTSPAITVTPEDSIDACCSTMEENKIRRMPVVDQFGNCCGMVSQADIARSAPEHETAEVVKEVSEPNGRSPRALFT
jgi:CBS domain-containing protein